MTRLILGAAAVLLLTVGQAAADGMPMRGKAKAGDPDGRPCTVSANVGLTTDYVFRGISRSNENAAVQGGADLTCGRFYLGVWSSSIYAEDATAEVDIYGGFRTTTGPINWDLGLIYYAYPGEPSPSSFDFGNYIELKVAASAELWRGGTLGGTVFYSPEYRDAFGNTWTFEGTFAQVLPNVGMFTPVFSATVGTIRFQDLDDADYVYWNVGLTLGFHEKWAVDLRYWDTDTDGGCLGLCDERFVASLKYRF